MRGTVLRATMAGVTAAAMLLSFATLSRVTPAEAHWGNHGDRVDVDVNNLKCRFGGTAEFPCTWVRLTTAGYDSGRVGVDEGLLRYLTGASHLFSGVPYDQDATVYYGSSEPLGGLSCSYSVWLNDPVRTAVQIRNVPTCTSS